MACQRACCANIECYLERDMAQPLFGIIFDVDGVLADTEAVNARASIKVFEDMFAVHCVRREDFTPGLGRGAEAYMLAAARAHGISMSAEELAFAVAARQENFLASLKQEPLEPFPGVRELIGAALGDGRFTVAIATSSTREKSGAVLAALGIPVWDMTCVTGSDVRRKKPDPELFETAIMRLGLPPRACVVVEDAPDGVAAAHAAGCRCIAVTNSTSRDRLRRADRIVGSLAETDLVEIVELLA